MSRTEIRASSALASIYALRMLGLFLILPVFALYAEHLPGGNDKTLVGLAMGIYGLTQAMLQIPFGAASDRFGRKPVMVAGLLIFALGSFVAGASSNLYWIIGGRAVQGAGAISAAISAMIADATRDEHRTKAMAMVGMTIGLSFVVSLLAGPSLYSSIGVPGMFDLTGLLALAAIGVIIWIVPAVPMVTHSEELEGHWARAVFTLPLLKLDLSIFVVNFLQVSMFVVLPSALVHYAGVPLARHWVVYLPVTVISFAMAIPAIIWAERYGRMKPILVGSVILLLLAMISFSAGYTRANVLFAALFVFFIAFNILEAVIPSLVSRTAPPSRKGLAMGIYNTSQSLGLFAGGAVGGIVAQRLGTGAVFLVAAGLTAAWIPVVLAIRPPAPRHSASNQI
jgi:MFS family permease